MHVVIQPLNSDLLRKKQEVICLTLDCFGGGCHRGAQKEIRKETQTSCINTTYKEESVSNVKFTWL